MVYLKVGKKYKTLKEIALQYNLPFALIKGRYARGHRAIEDLTKPKYHMYKLKQEKSLS